MQVNRHFSLKFVFLMPLVIALVVLALTIKNYYDSVNRDINDEYERINAALSRAAKVISALDYSFSNYSKSNYILLVEHNRQIKGDLCQMWPIDAACFLMDAIKKYRRLISITCWWGMFPCATLLALTISESQVRSR